MRVAVYARFSSDLQDNRSLTDQVAMAQKYADARGLKRIAIYEDATISGASVINRSGLQRLMNDAAVGCVQVTEAFQSASTDGAGGAIALQGLQFGEVLLDRVQANLVGSRHNRFIGLERGVNRNAAILTP